MVRKNPLYRCGKFTLDMSKPIIMGVINVTPDSLYGGLHNDSERAIKRGVEMAEQGADILDIGGESTRPGATPVSVEEEISRVIPVVSALSKKLSIPISVDTSEPLVMQQAIDAGASMINDVRSFSRKGAVDVVKNADVGLCIMHMLDEPGVMQKNPQYHDVVVQINEYLSERVSQLVNAGIARERIWIDPGFCFGKTVEHNLIMMKKLDQFCQQDLPVLVGVSRKSFLGHILDKDVDNRLFGTIAAVVLAAEKGAHVFRVHDVAPIHDALTFTHRVLTQEV